jgi:hypothetical protein
MWTMGITSRIRHCINMKLHDLLQQLDAIIDSLMETDVQRHAVREALAEWCDRVDTHIEFDPSDDPEVDELHLPGEELFGTEV